MQEDTGISLTKIYKILEKLDLKYNIVALDLKRLLNANRIFSLQKLILSNESTNLLLMVEFKLNDNVDLEVKDFFKNLCSELKNVSKTMKIIFFTQDKESFSSLASDLCSILNCNLYKTTQQGVKWNDLTNGSKLKILENKVLFQGNQLSLNKLTEGLLDETLNQLLDTKTIVKLSNNNNLIKIGPELSFKYDERYYIPRSLNYYTKINNNLFENKDIMDKFLISSKTEKLKISNNLECIFESDDEKAKCKFTELCDQYPKVHWLKYESNTKTFIWQKSKKDLSILREYIDYNNCTKSYSEQNLIQNNSQSKILIISDTAGMGKSTFLTHISKQTKQNSSNNDSWLIRLNLNDYTNKLNELTGFQETDAAIEFLSDILLKKSSLLEQELFKHNIKTGKSIIMFDGFDEISPDYKNIVIDLLKALIKYNPKQLWITTRPNMRIELEDNLQQFAYTLKPYSEKNQKDFLEKFWMNKLGISESDSRLVSYAYALLDNLKQSIRNEDFTGIPLQIRMLAEVYEKECSDFYRFNELKPKLKTKLDLNDLYEEFLKIKYGINFTEKKRIDLTEPQNREDFKEKTKIYENEYQIMAVYTLFNENTCTKLLQEDEVQIKETFIQDFKEGKKNIGIIDKIIEDKPEFIHKTYAEYLVVTFLINRLQREKILEFLIKELLLKSDYQVIRKFLNSWLRKKFLESRTLELFKNSNFKQLWENDNDCFNKLNEYNDSILHIAFEENNIEILKFVIENAKDKLDINFKNEEGNTVNHLVASRGNLEILKYLVENYKDKLDINAKNEKGTTALHKAASKEKWEIIKFLVENYKDKLDINAKNEFDNTVLHQAALRGNLQIIILFIENFQKIFDFNAKNRYGNTVLSIAVSQGNSDIVKFLKDHGAYDSSQII